MAIFVDLQTPQSSPRSSHCSALQDGSQVSRASRRDVQSVASIGPRGFASFQASITKGWGVSQKLHHKAAQRGKLTPTMLLNQANSSGFRCGCRGQAMSNSMRWFETRAKLAGPSWPFSVCRRSRNWALRRRAQHHLPSLDIETFSKRRGCQRLPSLESTAGCGSKKVQQWHLAKWK